MRTEERIVEMLDGLSLSVAVAESLTVGLVQARLGGVSGLSRVFPGGVVAYDRAAKVQLLGVSSLHAKREDSVSERVAEEMAYGVRVLFRSEIGIATTGLAEGAQLEAFTALSHGGFSASWHVSLTGRSRDAAREHVVDQILAELISYLDSLVALADR